MKRKLLVWTAVGLVAYWFATSLPFLFLRRESLPHWLHPYPVEWGVAALLLGGTVKTGVCLWGIHRKIRKLDTSGSDAA